MRFTPRFSITNAIAAALTEIERARGFLDAASLSDEWIDSMRSRAFLLEAHHTTHIEGTRLTIEEAADLLAGDDVPGADPDDTRELLNYRDAFEFVSTYLNDGGPITERLILDIHRHLVSGVSGGSAAPGQYRRVQNYVVNSATGETIYTPPPVRDVPILMRELVSWLNRPGDSAGYPRSPTRPDGSTGARPLSCAGVRQSYHQRVPASVPRNSAAHAPT